ncbi:unnamed protein product [Leptidea sinapis]|uniref:Uncharacterized protein n=1 Tax=Leptidea sinapis TaxID=189913 RepID=A0A5E4QTR0_9NEOP|nr:unnamed protein product [Leptidea sinapis]
MSALISRPWFRSRLKSYRGGHHSAPSKHHAASDNTTSTVQNHTTNTKEKKRTKLKRGRPPLSRKIQERERDDDTSTSGPDRRTWRASTESRGARRPSFDIDNIVIPQSEIKEWLRYAKKKRSRRANKDQQQQQEVVDEQPLILQVDEQHTEPQIQKESHSSPAREVSTICTGRCCL